MTGHFGPHLSFHSIPLGAYEFAVPSLTLALTYLLEVLAFIIFWRFDFGDIDLAIFWRFDFGDIDLAIFWRFDFGDIDFAIFGI